MSRVLRQEIEHPRFGPCIQLTNRDVELLVPRNFGPRILYYGLCGGANELCDNAPRQAKVGEEIWQMVGGHRFWHSPEAFPRTYMPDNESVQITLLENGLLVTQKEERWVQVEKELEITLAQSGGQVRIIHKLTNKNAWDINLASWGITLLEQGGEAWIPLPKRDTGYLSNCHLSLWPYSKMDDKRLKWGDRYIRVQQDPRIEAPCKLGLNNEAGWAAYFNRGNMFVKGFNYLHDKTYPDGGCSYETYLNDFMLEMESLSPMTTVKVGETHSHTEYWDLIPGVEAPNNEQDMYDLVQKKASKIFFQTS